MSYPWPTLMAINLLYLTTLPFSYRAQKRQIANES